MALVRAEVIGDAKIVDAVDGESKKPGEFVRLDDERTVIGPLVAGGAIGEPVPYVEPKAKQDKKEAD